jgi:hypothetical protein
MITDERYVQFSVYDYLDYSSGCIRALHLMCSLARTVGKGQISI